MRFLLITLLLPFTFFAQTKKTKLDSTFCDCKKAREVEVTAIKWTPKTLPPTGAGEIVEISNLSHDALYSFEKEHNSAWYKLKIMQTGTLVFDIIPTDKKDDYDFMFYKASSGFFCDSLLDFKTKPLRSAISRNKKDTTGKTGLDYVSSVEYACNAKGTPYAQKLHVKKGEVYYLVLDNNTENGNGHQLFFSITTGVLIEGVIIDENKKPVVAEITLTNSKGEVVEQEMSHKDGSYSIDAHLVRSEDYSLNFYQDNSLTYTKVFKVSDTASLKSLKTVLPHLRKGIKYSVGNINFHPGLTQTLPQALPAMKNLVKLMKKNPALKILIIGHMNGPESVISKEGGIDFTKGRAITVKNFLVSNGIDAARIEIDGKGDSEMLFPNPFKRTAEEEVQNRRVEIMVLEY